VVDWVCTAEGFRKIIEAERVVLMGGCWMSNSINPGTISGRTVVYVHTKKIVDDFKCRMFNLVDGWFKLSFGGEMILERINGKKIHYGGILFDGSPRDVYWGRWSEEFFEHEVPIIIEATALLAVDVKADVTSCINEAVELLNSAVESVYRRMVDVDRRLMGDGIKLGPRHNVDGKTQTILTYIHDVAMLNNQRYSGHGKQREADAGGGKEILGIKPGFFGVSVDLRELYRRIRRRYNRP